MQHVAIDLGGRESQICVRDEAGRIVAEHRARTRLLETFLASQPHCRLILEACAEAFIVARWAEKHGHDVCVVPGTFVRALGVGSRRTKTDKRDARALSNASASREDMPSIHLRSEHARQLQLVYGTREALVETRTKLINTVRGWMRTELITVKSGAAYTFTERVREVVFRRPDGIPTCVDRLLTTIDELDRQIGDANNEMNKIAKTSELCRRLVTAPGVGPITAVRFVAAIDEVSRFRNAHKLEAYLGLTPGEHSSSGRKRRLGITKAGPPAVRKLLAQAAWNAMRFSPGDPMVQWARRIKERRGTNIAIVALCRRLAGVLFAMWRDGTTYHPTSFAGATQ